MKKISSVQLETQRATETLEELQRDCAERGENKAALENTLREILEVRNLKRIF